MALWGKEADVALSGTGSVTESETAIVGAGTAFTTELQLRNTIDLDDNVFVVTSIIDDENIEVLPVSEVTLTEQAMLASETPKYLSVSDATENVSLVSTADAQNPDNREMGVKTPGWSHYRTYVAEDGSTRHRSEILVPFKS